MTGGDFFVFGVFFVMQLKLEFSNVLTLKNPRIPTLLKVAVKFICIKQGVFFHYNCVNSHNLLLSIFNLLPSKTGTKLFRKKTQPVILQLITSEKSVGLFYKLLYFLDGMCITV